MTNADSVHAAGRPPTAWTRDSETMLYATRALAESEMLTVMEELGLPVNAANMVLVRTAILAGASTAVSVVRQAGWLRGEPMHAIGSTALPVIADAVRPLLDSWEKALEDGSVTW